MRIKQTGQRIAPKANPMDGMGELAAMATKIAYAEAQTKYLIDVKGVAVSYKRRRVTSASV